MKSSESAISEPSGLAVTVERVVLSLWVGSLWSVGYLAVPTLFAVLDDRHLAGTIAGRMFFAETILTALAAFVLLIPGFVARGISTLRQPGQQLVLAAALLVCSSHWLVAPLIRAARMAPETSKAAFDLAHGLAATMYWIASVLALAALWRVSRRS